MYHLLSAAAQTSTAKPVSATSLMFQLLVGLAVVLGIIWVAAKIARGRIGLAGPRKRNTPLAVLSRQPLGKGVQIAVVKAGAEQYLLGITAHQVTRLARFKPDESELLETSSDDLPPIGRPGPGGAPPAFRLPSTFRLQSTLRQLQERTLRKG